MSALARWDAFLAQIESRAAGVRSEAEASARTFIANVAGGGDYQPLSHQLMAVRSGARARDDDHRRVARQGRRRDRGRGPGHRGS